MKVDREWLKAQCEIAVHTEPEEIDWQKELEGSPEALRWVEAELAAGNEWAWCEAYVAVTYRGFTERTTMGACSYQNEEEFRKDANFEYLVGECVDGIAEEIEALFGEHALWEHEKRFCIECIAEAP